MLHCSFAVKSRDRSRYGYKRLFPVAYRDSIILCKMGLASELNLAYEADYDSAEGNFTPVTPAIKYTSLSDALRIVSAITCALSIIGSLGIILSHIFSKVREILVHLSIMDLLYTTANFVGIILPYDKYIFHRKGREHSNFKRLCEAQAFLTVYETIGSILWALGLSVYLYYRLMTLDTTMIKRVVIMLYLVCYLLPLYPSLWLLLGGRLGYPQSAHKGGGWCTVLIEGYNKEESKYDQDLLLIMVEDIWIWLTFIVTLPIYLVVSIEFRIREVHDSIVSNNVHYVLGAAPLLHFYMDLRCTLP